MALFMQHVEACFLDPLVSWVLLPQNLHNVFVVVVSEIGPTVWNAGESPTSLFYPSPQRELYLWGTFVVVITVVVDDDDDNFRKVVCSPGISCRFCLHLWMFKSDMIRMLHCIVWVHCRFLPQMSYETLLTFFPQSLLDFTDEMSVRVDEWLWEIKTLENTATATMCTLAVVSCAHF